MCSMNKTTEPKWDKLVPITGLHRIPGVGCVEYSEPATVTGYEESGLPRNLHNPNQGRYKKVLCVCMGGLLRSATMAWMLSNEPWNCNTRAAGIDPQWSLVTVNDRLLEWADVILCCEPYQAAALRRMMVDQKPIHCLDIPDKYQYRDPELIERIAHALAKIGFTGK